MCRTLSNKQKEPEAGIYGLKYLHVLERTLSFKSLVLAYVILSPEVELASGMTGFRDRDDIIIS